MVKGTMRSLKGCVFCEKIDRFEAGCIEHDFATISFEPLNPVVEGHRLFVPRDHIPDAAEDPDVAARTMFYASWWVHEHFQAANIITSIGTAATQSVFHLHIHVIPRFEGDGLKLPWTDQQKEA